MNRRHPNYENLVILIDTREKKPFTFLSPTDPTKPLPTERVALQTGDYSLKGLHNDEVAIERKSLDDLLQCVGNERERFEKEIYRLLGFRTRAVVVEASWDYIMMGRDASNPAMPWRSQLKPNQVMGSIIGWQDLGVPFFFHPDRTILASWVRAIMWTRAKRCYQKWALME
jgi:DNA excision repair protein ERCC-4